MDINAAQFRADIKRHEGTVRLPNGAHKLYQCPAKKWTIGWGWNIQDRGLPDDGLSPRAGNAKQGA